ncbi:GldG family protein [bacterium]|nr:GldG family protein [bacterium]
MRKRKVQLTTQTVISVLILFGVLVIINGISQKKFCRLDLTKNKQYTVSPATKKILAGLDDIVTIKLFFSKNLPPVMAIQERRVKDMLDEYRAYSKGKIVIKRIDPASDPKLEQQVRSIGIPQVQMTFREKDNIEVKNGYLGIGIFYADKTEVLPIVQHIDNLEYDLTSAIRKVTRNEIIKIGLLTGQGERDFSDEFSFIRGVLDQQYDTVMVDLKNGLPIPEDVKLLIIAGPKKDFSKRDLFEIDQFVMRGGKLVVLFDTINIDFKRGLMATARKNNFSELLANYGIRVNTNLVLDRYMDKLTYSESPDNRIQYVTTVNYPYFVKAVKTNFDKDNPITRGLQSLTLPWISSVNIDSGKLADAKITRLIKSSEFAWETKGRFNLNPKQQFNVPPDQEKQFDLAVIVTDKFKSMFEGKEIPAVEKSEQSDPNAPPPPDDSDRKIIAQSPQTQIFVMGSSYFITMDSLRRFSGNGVFFMNAVDWMAQGDALIGIRSRSVEEYPIKDLSDAAKSGIKFINVFGGSVLLVIIGFAIFYLRRREKIIYENMSLK